MKLMTACLKIYTYSYNTSSKRSVTIDLERIKTKEAIWVCYIVSSFMHMENKIDIGITGTIVYIPGNGIDIMFN